MKRTRLLPALLLLTVLAISIPAYAARTAPTGKPVASTATLQVTPNPVAAYGATYTVTGTGFPASTLIYIQESRPSCCTSFNRTTDALGNLRYSSTTWSPGTYTVQAFAKSGRKFVELARTTFTVSG